MTKEELIDVTCKWMDYNNSKEHYVTTTSKGRIFINGGYQTDLRAYLNSVKDKDYWEVMDELYDANHK